MKNSKLFFVVAMVAFLFVSISSASAQATFKLVNQSDWTIEQVYFSPTWDDAWGSDKLGNNVLEPGYEITLTLSAGCGDYDVKFIDEDGDECVVSDVYICNDEVEISSADLLECYGY